MVSKKAKMSNNDGDGGGVDEALVPGMSGLAAVMLLEPPGSGTVR